MGLFHRFCLLPWVRHTFCCQRVRPRAFQARNWGGWRRGGERQSYRSRRVKPSPSRVELPLLGPLLVTLPQTSSLPNHRTENHSPPQIFINLTSTTAANPTCLQPHSHLRHKTVHVPIHFQTKQLPETPSLTHHHGQSHRRAIASATHSAYPHLSISTSVISCPKTRILHLKTLPRPTSSSRAPPPPPPPLQSFLPLIARRTVSSHPPRRNHHKQL